MRGILQRVIQPTQTKMTAIRQRSRTTKALSSLVYHSFMVEHVLEISLFAAFPPRSRLIDIKVMTPLPHFIALSSQIIALQAAEESFRIWAQAGPMAWMMRQEARQADDSASILAVEYIIPKAALTLVMTGIGTLRVLGLPVEALHISAIMYWTASRQFWLFGISR